MEEVALALILAFDGSASVTLEEFGLMASGCAAALRGEEVVAGLVAGGSIVAVLLWSGPGAQEVMVEWTLVATAEDVAALARAVEEMPRVVRAGETAIGEALVVCARMLAEAPVAAVRQVVDVVGDGRSNRGILPGPVRDRLVAAGVVINGLCVLHEEPDLVESYTREVIGGEGSFALWCRDYAGFAAAMAQKLAREVA